MDSQLLIVGSLALTQVAMLVRKLAVTRGFEPGIMSLGADAAAILRLQEFERTLPAVASTDERMLGAAYEPFTRAWLQLEGAQKVIGVGYSLAVYESGHARCALLAFRRLDQWVIEANGRPRPIYPSQSVLYFSLFLLYNLCKRKHFYVRVF